EEDLRASPQRDEDGAPVRRHEARVRLRRKGHGPGHGAGRKVHGRESLREYVHGVEARAARADRDPADERLSFLVALRDPETGRELEPSVFEPEFLDRVGGGAGGVELRPVRMPGEAEPGVLEGDLLAR